MDQATAFRNAILTNDLMTAATLLSETKDDAKKQRAMLSLDVLSDVIFYDNTGGVRLMLANCPDDLVGEMVGTGQGIASAVHHAAGLRPSSSSFDQYDNGPLRALLDDPRVATVEMFNQLDNGSHNDGVQITVLMEAAHEQGNYMAMRLLLSHPVADAARMIATRDACGRNSLMLLAERGCVAGMRELLTHPDANKSALLSDRVFRPEYETPETHGDGEGIWLLLKIGEPYADGGESALTLAARYAVQNSTVAPLVFLLHWCITSWDEAERSEQQTHSTAVLGLLSGEDADADADTDTDGDADAAMQECVQLLLQLGASDKHVKLSPDMQRIVRRARRDMA